MKSRYFSMPKSSLPVIIFLWYRELGVVWKVLYPLIAIVLYLLSVLVLVGIYWLKTDLGYNLITGGGWHTFSKCIADGFKI